GRTSLHFAAWHGHLIIVSMLLERGADVNATDVHHHTPLHDAAQKGHAEIAKLLVDRGAALEARSMSGWT
ncbi:ankyrin, partial [Schizophyllum commune H4-8]|uniref:ankyrin n=1 Tax=Schizophyllum commune (strain H4-8 / FGSC 9210) TaxID=578458 RepID=UPI00215F6CD5